MLNSDIPFTDEVESCIPHKEWTTSCVCGMSRMDEAINLRTLESAVASYQNYNIPDGYHDHVFPLIVK
jgi:hypothetical protein